MVLAVEERDLAVGEFVAGDHALAGGLHDALLDGGDELAGDGAADDFAVELQAGPAREGPDLDGDAGVLPVATGLLLMRVVGG